MKNVHVVQAKNIKDVAWIKVNKKSQMPRICHEMKQSIKNQCYPTKTKCARPESNW